jgi:hypothetical protein
MRLETIHWQGSSPVFYHWLCFLIAAYLLIPPYYPDSLGGVPLYLGNFVFIAGAVIFLNKSSLITIHSDQVLRFGFYFLSAVALSLPFAWWFSGPKLCTRSLLRYALLCQPFLIYWLIRSSPIFVDDARLKSFVELLVWIGAVVGVYGIIDFYWPIPLPHPFAEQFMYLKGQALRRAQGVFYESSSFGNLCAFFLSLTSCLTLSIRSLLSRRQQLKIFLLSGIFVTALFLSYSRGSWMAVFVTLAVFLILSPGIRLHDLIVTVLVCSLPILILNLVSPEIVSNFFNYRVGSIGEFSRNPNFATSGRWGSWSVLIQYFAIHPWLLLFGVGYKTLPYSTLFGKTIIADNGYLSILFECGVVGLITFLGLNFSLLKSFQQVRHVKNPFRCFVGTFMLAFWFGELAQLTTGDIFTYWRNLILFFALAAAIPLVKK